MSRRSSPLSLHFDILLTATQELVLLGNSVQHFKDFKLGELYMELRSVSSCLEAFLGLHIQNVKPARLCFKDFFEPRPGPDHPTGSQRRRGLSVSIVRKLKGALKRKETLLGPFAPLR